LRQVFQLGRRAAALATLLALAPWAAAFAAPGVEPKVVNVSLAPGASTDIPKTVHTPPIVPKPDIYFLADTTGSMGGVLANVKANAGSILSQVDGVASDPRYGAGDYKDFPIPGSSPYAYKNGAAIPGADDDGAAALAAISAWSASGGADGPEANLFALHKLLGLGGAAFRGDSTRIVVWFGDAPGHDPVCSAISGELGNVTEGSVTAELVAAKVKVIAVSTTTGYPNGLDDDPVTTSADYGVCGAPGGSAGQATRIATATGGTVFKDVPPEDVSNAIIEGLTNLPVEVTPKATCDTGLTATFDAPSKTVTSGTDASFTETITLAPDAPTGDLHCTVDFLLNGEPAGDDFVQKINRLNRPPDCSKLTANPASLWPPNHRFVTVTVNGASDPDADPVTTTITGVTQDEPINGLGDGDTAPDAAWPGPVHANQVKLRAERSGTGNGRVYRIAVTVSDGHATCTGTVTVGVPHDQSGPPAVDSSPPSYNSFGP
jgi:hypothetical protein